VAVGILVFSKLMHLAYNIALAKNMGGKYRKNSKLSFRSLIKSVPKNWYEQAKKQINIAFFVY
jgi:hypothetical protein